MDAALDALSRKLGERYVIERELGRGGMGAVYLARDRRLDRPVALKVLPPEFAVVPELRERFLRETRLAAGFSHPNIVPVFAIEETDDVLAFAMGFVEGESLAARVAREGPLSRRDAVRLMTDVGYALAYAHGRGVVHRDIKPDNIMIERATGRALVMDFGIARAITPMADKPGLTRVGEVVGTPEYMSPEQAAGESVDGRADLYSLGLVMWFGLSGRVAVTGDTTQRILVKQLTEAVPPLASVRPDVPASLGAVVDQCCAKEADDRFASAEALVEALDAAQLTAPEIPVAIRLLAPELSSVTIRGLAAIVLFGFGLSMVIGNNSGNGNLLAVSMLIGATAWVGAAGALREVRRLVGSGYAVTEVQRLLALTLGEKDDERARRKADVVTVKQRKRRVLIACGILLSLLVALIAMRQGADASGQVHLQGKAAALTFFGAFMAGALAIAMLIASPFRRSISERLFNVVWLGAIGRTLFQLAAGRKREAAPAAVVTRTVTAPAASPDAIPSIAASLSALEARVAALEARRG
jgi:eukaryotic-like serine/threonine-protein kinase